MNPTRGIGVKNTRSGNFHRGVIIHKRIFTPGENSLAGHFYPPPHLGGGIPTLGNFYRGVTVP